MKNERKKELLKDRMAYRQTLIERANNNQVKLKRVEAEIKALRGE